MINHQIGVQRDIINCYLQVALSRVVAARYKQNNPQITLRAKMRVKVAIRRAPEPLRSERGGATAQMRL